MLFASKPFNALLVCFKMVYSKRHDVLENSMMYKLKICEFVHKNKKGPC